MSKLSICFAGLSRQEEAEVVSLFKQANAQAGNHWVVAPETDARVLVIDMDSMYGQMSLMKALGTDKTLVALTAGSRADTDHVLSRPVTAAKIGSLLAAIESGAAPAPAAAAKSDDAVVPAGADASPMSPAPAATAAPAPAATPTPAPAPASSPAPTPEPAPADPSPVAASEPVPSPRVTGERPAIAARADRRLIDFLRDGALPGPVRLQHGDAPEIVLDPATQTWLGGAALKPLMPYGTAALTDADFAPVAAADLPALEARLGGRHPYARLAWLCALAGGGGALLPGYGPNERYKLLKWPQTEREFPKHFRIATVMMKGPALLTDIAEASGVGLDEVIDYVNASLAIGVAEADVAAPATAEAAKGGLLGRFRR